MDPAVVDRQLQTYALFQAQLKEEIRGLITPELIEEHRRQPLGRHSDALERVLNFFRRPPAYALYSPRAFREWQIVRLPIDPSAPPTPIDDTVYRTEDEAYHALFLRNIADLTAG